MYLSKKPRLFAIMICLSAVTTSFAASKARALEITDDGRALIIEAQQAYRSDMENRPVVTDKAINTYATDIIERLVPKGQKPPAGVTLSATVLESPQPELYSYVDGHIILTMGVLFAMKNEAQIAGVLSHEVANIVEGYYIGMYQEIKAAERSQRRKAAVGALFGDLMDVAVDYAVDVHVIDLQDKWWSDGATYSSAMKEITTLYAAQSAYYSIRDVAASIPEKDDKGQWIDPRLRFEPIADAQGMAYTALAGYDCRETAEGWDRLYRIKSRIAKQQADALGPWADQLRETRSLMQLNMNRMRQSLGASGLVQTRSDIPPTRAEFVSNMVNLKEVHEAEKNRKPSKGEKGYQAFLEKSLIPRAAAEMENENYENAYASYKALWDNGIHTAAIAYGMAKCKLGDFAFGASTAEKKEAEKAYLQATGLDPKYAAPYKGLGELYEDWERYQDAVDAYKKYLEINPKADDRKRIERKIKTLQRKADR